MEYTMIRETACAAKYYRIVTTVVARVRMNSGGLARGYNSARSKQTSRLRAKRVMKYSISEINTEYSFPRFNLIPIR